MAESADFSERRGFDKNKRTGQPAAHPAGIVPQLRDESRHKMFFIQPDGHAARETTTGTNLLRHVRKQFRARMRVGVHEDQPVAGGGSGTGVPRAGNLVDRLEYDSGPGGASDIGGGVGGIVVADDKFKFQAEPRDGGGGSRG